MNLTLKNIATIEPDPKRDIYIWDDEVAGFGLRIKPSNVRSFILQYRNANGISRRITLCKLGVKNPEDARKLAKKKLAEVAEGLDPASERNAARKATTVSELCDLYIKDAKSRIKPSTLAEDSIRIECHVKPLIGNKPVIGLTLADIEKFQNDIAVGKTAQPKREKGKGRRAKGGRGVAARTTGMLVTILEYAKRQNIIKENPARGVKKFPDEKRRRFLSIEEIEKLGQAMRDAVAVENKTGIAAITALLLTGCRKTEILGLPWAWLDAKARCIRFGDTKTGAQLRPIGTSAVTHLTTQPRKEIEKSGKKIEVPWIFPADRGEGHFIGLPKVLERLCARAGIADVTLHTLRHSFASVAAELGYSELTIAGLLGHTMQGVTARYSHLPDRALLSAADTVSARIMAALEGKIENTDDSERVVPLHSSKAVSV